MNTFYKGDEIKFAIDIKAPGFSMDDDDFEVEVKCGSTSIKGSKAQPTLGLRIFKETGESSSSDWDSSSSDWDSSSSEEEKSEWFAIADTNELAIGTMRVVTTAFIVDAHANDGVRKDISVSTLGKLLEP